MSSYRKFALNKLAGLGPKYLPFADVATEDVSLLQLLRLSLFQVTVGMALVLMVGTLNRVMIVELNVPSSVVALMISLPILFAPFRAYVPLVSPFFWWGQGCISSKRSAWLWRRIWCPKKTSRRLSG